MGDPGRPRVAAARRAGDDGLARPAAAVEAGAVIHQLIGRLRAVTGDTGHADLAALRAGARLVRIGGTGLSEGHVRDVQITR